MAVTPGWLEEPPDLKRTISGYEGTRTFLVTDVSGSNDAAKVANALQASGIPIPGEEFPSVPLCLCEETRATLIEGSKSAFKVTATYRTPEDSDETDEPDDSKPGTLRIGATVQSVPSSKDHEGKTIKIEYLAGKGTEGEASKASKPVVPIFDKQVALPTATFTRRETTSPFNNALLLVGKINSGTVFSGAKHTWLCTRIEGETEDKGESWTVVYEFIYNDGTWNPLLVYTKDGVVPDDIEEGGGDGNGKRQPQIYKEANFTALNLV
jgi:hypothetical protein